MEEWIRRHRYTIRVNIDVIRHAHLTMNNESFRMEFNKPTKVVAMVFNEPIPERDISPLIVNSILFFRNLNVQHVIFYDYRGDMKKSEPLIMDYLHNFEKKSRGDEAMFLSTDVHP